MSALKPEIGDVWEDSKGPVHISRIFTLSDGTRAKPVLKIYLKRGNDEIKISL